MLYKKFGVGRLLSLISSPKATNHNKMIYLKTQEEVELIRESSLLVSKTIAEVAKEIRPGVTTLALDKLAEEFIRDNGGEPAFLNYNGFPNSLCISVNSQVVHGIPNQNELKEIFNLSIKNYRSDFAQVCLKGIKDLSVLLTESIIKQDLAAIEYLLDPKLKICNSTMLSDLINSYDKSSGEYQFIIGFEDLFISDQTDNGVQNMGDSIQDIY